MSKSIEVVILAAGQGTRMKSDLPKVLHPLAGKPLLGHVLDTAAQLQPSAIHVVYGHGGELVRQRLASETMNWILQAQQLGTGHAVEQALPAIADDSVVLVLYGDVPLIRSETLASLAATASDGLGLLTVDLVDPTGYGRIVRDSGGAIQRIVEQKDATPEELAITEVNSGIMAVAAGRLKAWIAKLENNNAQGEFYLTDIIGLAVADGLPVHALQVSDIDEVLGVNDRVQLAHLERRLQRRRAEELMRGGVTLRDPQRFDLRGSLRHGRDVEIDVGVILEGDVVLGDRVRIGASSVLRNVTIGDDVEIRPFSVIENAVIGNGGFIGPFARIRPGTTLADGVHVGNFVEIKNAQIGDGSKVNHLSYIGDTTMGASVNIGAGTITANYDGANKHRTTIGDRASVGSNSVLVAPVNVGDGATLGAGTILRKDAPDGELTIMPVKEKTVRGWKRPEKKS